jgi:heme/copper-type cytochrome/quinol oxidase subunit 4
MSDCLIFAVLFATFGVLVNNTAGGPAGELFDLRFVLGETMLLLTSSLTFGVAMIKLQDGKANPNQVIRWMVLTFALGAAFVGMEIFEFMQLIHEGAARAAAPICRRSSCWWARTAARHGRAAVDHRDGAPDPGVRPRRHRASTPGLPEPVLALPGSGVDLRFLHRLPEDLPVTTSVTAHESSHGSIRSHLIGYGLSVVLTRCPSVP